MMSVEARSRAYETAPAASCPECGNLYVGMGLFFLYSDERGFRCHDCGNILAHESCSLESAWQPLVVPAGLEGSRLHERLKSLAERDGMRVLVDPTGGERTIHPKSRQAEVRSP